MVQHAIEHVPKGKRATTVLRARVCPANKPRPLDAVVRASTLALTCRRAMRFAFGIGLGPTRKRRLAGTRVASVALPEAKCFASRLQRCRLERGSHVWPGCPLQCTLYHMRPLMQACPESLSTSCSGPLIVPVNKGVHVTHVSPAPWIANRVAKKAMQTQGWCCRPPLGFGPTENHCVVSVWNL